MTAPVHLIVGDDQHGVVLHAAAVAAACGHDVLRVPDAGAALHLGFDAYDVVHVAFTDRLFGDTCEEAAEAFARVADRIGAAGAQLSVTVHDVPRQATPLDARRAKAYRAVTDLARGVVFCSRVELAADLGHDAHSRRMIPLPIDRVEPAPTPTAPTDRDVAVLGFVFPDRGYETVLRALPAGSGLVALGRPARGHDALPGQLAALAAELGRSFRTTGFVPDAELASRLLAAAVPVAPNARVGASGSIGTWLAHGRRPIVPRTEHTTELLDRMPGCVVAYDPASPDELRAAVQRALDDPSQTWLAGRCADVGPDPAAVARTYREHLSACAPPAAEVGRNGEVLVPGNRWDLLPEPDAPPPLVTVVVPHHDDQHGLDLVLTALRAQTVADRLEVVVGDDGSPRAPHVDAAGDLPARVVRQERHGFGAARARNLGAATARGDVIVFLDGDTVPAPDYVQRLAAWPHRHRDVVAVGRRRHADFDGWSADDVDAWSHGLRPGPQELPEPHWLRQAYRATRNLLDADARSYRYLISATLAMHRSMVERLGGFDESFDHYGGEDWELANRAWHAGALFVHEPAAVAWHDGPDWAGRDQPQRRAAKNAETLTLSRLLPDPALRGGGPWTPYPHVVVRLASDDAADVLVTVRSALAAGVDCGCWLTGPHADDTARRLAHAFVQAGPVPPDVLSRAAVVADVAAPCDLSGLAGLAAAAIRHGAVHAPAVVARSTRALARCGPDDELLGRLFGRHEVSDPAIRADVRLERDLTPS